METIGADRDGVSRKDAEKALRDRLVKVEQRGYRRPTPVTFAEWSSRWFEEADRRRHWKPKTATTHGHRLTHLDGYFGKSQLGAIRPSDVNGYIQNASATAPPVASSPRSTCSTTSSAAPLQRN